MMTSQARPYSSSAFSLKALGLRLQSVLLSLMLALVLSACSGTRELGPTAFIDADTTDYIKDERDFPELGKYDDAPPVTRNPSNVLDLVKSLPETVRSFRNRDEVAEETPESDLIRADMPAAKPDAVTAEEPAPDVPANDIAKSLIGDLSSNDYTAPVRTDGFDLGISDNEMPATVSVADMSASLRFAPQLVVPKTLSAPKAYTRRGAWSAGGDLASLRQSVYLSKLTQSSAKLTEIPRAPQFARSTVTSAHMTASLEASRDRLSSPSDAVAPDDQSFVVLARINADGLIVSAASARMPVLVQNTPDDQRQRLAEAASSPDRAAAGTADWQTVAFLTGTDAPAVGAGFAAR